MTRRLRGIDVSHHQGDISWPRVRADGIDAAILKATEATSWTDPNWHPNISQARRALPRVSAYHYARPASSPPRDQAVHFLTTVDGQHRKLPLALDLEEHGGMTRRQLTSWTLGFLAELRQADDRKPLLYLSPAFYDQHLDPSVSWSDHAHLWVAHWQVKSPRVPPGWERWAVWQHTSRGRVDGIDGRVDLDWIDPEQIGAAVTLVRHHQGSDRYATAAQVAADAYPDGSAVVYLASSEVDAATTPAGGPVLYTEPDRLPGPTRQALRKLQPHVIVSVGQVSEAVRARARQAADG